MDVVWKKVPEVRSIMGGVGFLDRLPRNLVCRVAGGRAMWKCMGKIGKDFEYRGCQRYWNVEVNSDPDTRETFLVKPRKLD